MIVSWCLWTLFGFLVLAMLALDLGLASRGSENGTGVRSAMLWSAAWIGLSLLFGGAIWGLFGPEPAVTYLTAYVLEKSLSVDNVFVFVIIFSELQTPPAKQRKVLYWGVLGALVMRGILIAGGMYLILRFHWLIYPFAVIVLLAAARILFGREQEREVVVAGCDGCSSGGGRSIPLEPVQRGEAF